MVYVLDSVHGFDRSRVAEVARSLLVHPDLAVMDVATLLRAVELYESLRLGFDRGLDRVKSIERVEP
jgi:hypothetical protein